MTQAVWAIGIMSGTSLDGVDVALLKTDGKQIVARGPWLTVPYDNAFIEQMSHITQQSGDIALTEREFTLRCVKAVEELLKLAQMSARDVHIIGFHGQTIDHRPDLGITWQIGDGALMAARTGINVVSDFRRRDMAEGGQGAPMVPLYHAALLHDMPKPIAVLNIGGMANVTWIEDEANNPWILAFDTGPGNNLMNMMMQRSCGEPYDDQGKVAASGTVNQTALEGYLYDTYFSAPPPKSVDRYDFGLEPVLHLSLEDAMATLLEFTVQSIAKAQPFLPLPPRTWLVAGGGARNPVLMDRLSEVLGRVQRLDDLEMEGDAIEAQAFAFLAVRSLRNLPLTLPQLTGGRRPTSGGAFYRA